ncbi:MAG: ssDNA-binding domain-containing protein [Firmicutes bacterium]|nr:ssDNA-binding domain-containing protein [Bacillota bacterium]
MTCAGREVRPRQIKRRPAGTRTPKSERRQGAGRPVSPTYMKIQNGKNEKVQALFERLKEGVQEVVASGRIAEMFAFWSRFHKYSFGNVLLIFAQKPDATHCAGYRTWQKCGRQVKKGEKGIAIFAPLAYRQEVTDEETGETVTRTRLGGFRVVHVFDVSQTEGEPLPGMSEAPAADTRAGRDLFDRLVEVAAGMGVIVMEDRTGAAKGYYDRSRNLIALSETLAGDEKAAVLLHELAHALAHRLGEQKAHKKRGDQEYARGEVIAEGAAYIAACHFGIDPGESSFEYVAGWAKDPEKVLAWGDAVRRVAGELISLVETVPGGKEAA